ncbi:MAG: hypothetical protein MJK04_23615, partial [Psychrosphaera sp.]|nr:hypothetical protein [Psychrosphaera sp.]
MPITPFNIPANDTAGVAVNNGAGVAVNTLHQYLIPPVALSPYTYNRADLQLSRNGRNMRSSIVNLQQSITDVACANFAVVGRMPSDLGLMQVFEARDELVPTNFAAAEICSGIEYYSAPGRRKITVGSPPPSRPGNVQLNLANGGVVDATRMGLLRSGYDAAIGSVGPYARSARNFGSNAAGVTRKGAVEFARNA